MLRPYYAVAVLLAIAACDRPSIVEPRTSNARPSYDLAGQSDGATLTTFFGPREYSRGDGAPDAFTTAINTSGYEAPFVLHVDNGDGRPTRVSSAIVSLDGVTLLDASAFSKQSTSFDIPVSPAAMATLSVRLAGAPGTFLRISLAGHRIGTHFCANGSETSAYTTMDAALANTPEGGTILVCDGVNTVSNVSLGGKSVTITAEHEHAAVLDAHGAGSVFSVSTGATPSAASLTLRDLTFQNASFSAVFITQNYGTVDIENNRFFPDQHVVYGAAFDGPHNGVQMYLATGHGVTIRGNSFTGGDNGASVNASDGFVVDGNTFTNQTEGAILIGSAPLQTYSSSGSVTNNVVNGCGKDWCVAFFSAGDIVASGNSITIDLGRRTQNALWISARTATVDGNTITGTGVGSARSGESSYPISVAIGTFGDPSLAQPVGTFTRNRISGSWSAFWFDNSQSTVSNNVASTMYTVLGGWGPALGNAVTVNRNDFADYIVALGAVFDGFNFDPTYSFVSANLRCNWWGSASGPLNPVFFGSSTFTPFATQPIAGNAHLTCP